MLKIVYYDVQEQQAQLDDHVPDCVYYGAGCANATGKGEREGSPVNAQKRACMRAMTKKND